MHTQEQEEEEVLHALEVFLMLLPIYIWAPATLYLHADTVSIHVSALVLVAMS